MGSSHLEMEIARRNNIISINLIGHNNTLKKCTAAYFKHLESALPSYRTPFNSFCHANQINCSYT